MRKVICDECKNEEKVNYAGSNPPGWCDIRMTGNVTQKGKTFLQRVNFEVMLCDVCVSRKFNFEEAKPKTIQEQFEEIASQYLQDLCIEAAQEAVENV